MLTRSTKTTATFSHSFRLGERDTAFPPGDYEIVVEEELLQGLSFEAYRRTATYLVARGRGNRAGQTKMHTTTPGDLKRAIACDEARSETFQNSQATVSLLEDLT